MNFDRKIFITFQREGVHKYPEALTNPELESVSFLGYPHRHMFHFTVEVDVQHSNRDLEFIMLKRELEETYGDGTLELDYKSCEMMAEDLISLIHNRYPHLKHIKVTVSEDGENGAVITWNKEAQ